MEDGGRTRWPWVVFGLAAAWSVLVRVPLVLNAGEHLDSDLAVDGLTLLDATRGHWRWHYPGTPFMGAGPVLLSLPQGLAFGVGPETLVSGGVVAHLGLLLGVFLVAWRALGPGAAAWAMAPLAFASNGAVWLSGRITGGHLAAAAWHAGAFALLAGSLRKGGLGRAAALGAWCGFGLYLDSMFAVSLLGLIGASLVAWQWEGASWRALAVAGLAFVAGVWPRPLGAWIDPYDAYREQFTVVTDRPLLAAHARLLALECLPRLVAGHGLPGLETHPDPATLSGRPAGRRRAEGDPVGALAVGLAVVVGAASATGLARALVAPGGTGRIVVLGLLVSAAATIGGFVANRNIYNTDNYRYLVGILVPWSLGFGVAADRLARRGKAGRVVAAGFVAVLAVGMTLDVGRWYARFGWVDGRGVPARKPVDDPALAWLDAHRDVTWISGGYWDVYRLAFLTGGRVRGAPFPVYPNRFPDWHPAPGARAVTLVRPTPEGMLFREKAEAGGEREVFRARGLAILGRP